jgi:phage shock protein C
MHKPRIGGNAHRSDTALRGTDMTTNRHRYSESSSASRLYRNTEDGLLMGVCAGLADYFGFDRTVTRVVTVVAAFFFAPTVIIAYVLLGLLLKKSPESKRMSFAESALRQRVRAEPHATLDSVRHRFRELDRRMQRLERLVTSKRYRLEREFEGLKD